MLKIMKHHWNLWIKKNTLGKLLWSSSLENKVKISGGWFKGQGHIYCLEIFYKIFSFVCQKMDALFTVKVPLHFFSYYHFFPWPQRNF